MKIPAASTQNNKKNKVAHFQQNPAHRWWCWEPQGKGSRSSSSKRRWWTIYWVDLSLPSVFLIFSLFLLSVSHFSSTNSFIISLSFFFSVHFGLSLQYFVIRRNMCNNLIHFNLKLFPVLTHNKNQTGNWKHYPVKKITRCWLTRRRK